MLPFVAMLLLLLDNTSRLICSTLQTASNPFVWSRYGLVVDAKLCSVGSKHATECATTFRYSLSLLIAMETQGGPRYVQYSATLSVGPSRRPSNAIHRWEFPGIRTSGVRLDHSAS